MKEFRLSWVLHRPVEPARLIGNWLFGLKKRLGTFRWVHLGGTGLGHGSDLDLTAHRRVATQGLERRISGDRRHSFLTTPS
jgi:hypothetical protein